MSVLKVPLKWPEVLSKGEAREISIIVEPAAGSAAPVFVSPQYQVLDGTGAVAQAAAPATDAGGGVLKGALSSATTAAAGTYTVRFTYQIGSESFQDDVLVSVE